MLLIQTALHAEARALITHFNLKRQHDEHAFAYFANGDVHLVESGTGKTNAATSVGWLSAQIMAENPVWLNIGMAGHAEHNIGELKLAHRIEDEAKGHRWYPPILVDQPPASDNLLTVEQLNSGYPENALVDMEASGFFTAACRFTSLELIHSLKVISDNQQIPPTRMKPKEIDDLIEPHLVPIQQYAEQLVELRSTLDDATRQDFLALRQQHHFSTYQQHSLRRLLQRYHALHPDEPALEALPASVSNAKAILRWFIDEIEQSPLAV